MYFTSTGIRRDTWDGCNRVIYIIQYIILSIDIYIYIYIYIYIIWFAIPSELYYNGNLMLILYRHLYNSTNMPEKNKPYSELEKIPLGVSTSLLNVTLSPLGARTSLLNVTLSPLVIRRITDRMGR